MAGSGGRSGSGASATLDGLQRDSRRQTMRKANSLGWGARAYSGESADDLKIIYAALSAATART